MEYSQYGNAMKPHILIFGLLPAFMVAKKIPITDPYYGHYRGRGKPYII